MKITAVVVTYNRKDLLKRGIDSLRKQEHLSDIIVINNGSTDGTNLWLAEQKDLTVITQDNVGGSGGFYTGIKTAFEAGADWIWCMDDDVFPRPECLSQLLNVVNTTDAKERLGILSPRRLMEGKVFTHEFCHFNFTNPLGSMHGKKLNGTEVVPTKIVGCDFEGPFISREVVQAIGLPNKDFFIFCDDTDYCLRAHFAGFSLCYVPAALMDKHRFFTEDNWTTRNQKKKWKRYYQVRNQAFLNHHYGKNWGVRYLRSWIGVIGYVIPAFLSMPFTDAWKWSDLKMLWKAYHDGTNEVLGKNQ